MSDTKLKMLKEVFKDFEVNNNIINTKIESINLYKKTNKLEVNILSFIFALKNECTWLWIIQKIGNC